MKEEEGVTKEERRFADGKQRWKKKIRETMTETERKWREESPEVGEDERRGKHGRKEKV